MRRLISLVAVLSSVALFAPAAHAEDTVTGFLCDFASTSDFTGAVDPDPNVQYGEIDGGPITVARPVGESPIISVTITCSIQIGSTDPAAPDVVSVSATGSGNVAWLAPTAMTFRAEPGEDVPLCTHVEWVTRDGRFSWDYDQFPEWPGIQCALAI